MLISKKMYLYISEIVQLKLNAEISVGIFPHWRDGECLHFIEGGFFDLIKT